MELTHKSPMSPLGKVMTPTSEPSGRRNRMTEGLAISHSH